MADLVAFKDIAKRLGLNPSTVSRLIDRFGSQLEISIQRGRGKASNAKLTNYLSRDDADRLIAFYEGGKTHADDEASGDFFQTFGVFYVIQLVPEAMPNRMKIGYADNLDQRLANHRTAAPTARVLASWPCKRSWDYAAMDSIAGEGCK